MSVADPPTASTTDSDARTIRHPSASAVLAILLAAAAAVLIADLAGLHAVGEAFDHLTPSWIPLAVITQALGVPAYATAYLALTRRVTGRRPPRRRVTQLVLAGFGTFTIGGGFAYDARTMRRVGLSQSVALRTVLGLSGVELLALVWLAFAAAIVALVRDPRLGGALTLPWLIAVPVGTGIAVLVDRRSDSTPRPNRRVLTGALLSSLADVLGFARHPRDVASGWAGIVVYWLADGATLYLALRTFGLHPAPEAVALAYATGYLLSRRTLPLGGAGFIELLMTFSLYWVHEPLAPALAAVLLYRALDFLLAAGIALVARVRLEAALDARESSAPDEPASAA